MSCGGVGGMWSKVQHAVVRARLDWVLVVIERWREMENGGRVDNSEHVFLQPGGGLGST